MNSLGLEVGDRVYHRRADLFGTVVDYRKITVLIRYDWPYDPKAEPVWVPMAELEKQ